MKIVILDESDYISPQAQAALRNLMETFSLHTRFILTCNYVERMIDPIVSRTQQFQIIPPSKADVAKHIIGILNKENVTFDLKDLKVMVDAYYPDIRKILNECQLSVHENEMVVDERNLIESHYELKVIEILSSKDDKKKKFQQIRQVIADAKIRDFANLYSLLYSKVDEYAPSNISQAILAISEGCYKDSLVMDKEINMMGTVINLLQAI